MKRVRALAPKKLKTINNRQKEVKVKIAKSHIKRGPTYSQTTKTWCGQQIGNLPMGDFTICEEDFLLELRRFPATQQHCSCCDNAIANVIRGRMLKI